MLKEDKNCFLLIFQTVISVNLLMRLTALNEITYKGPLEMATKEM